MQEICCSNPPVITAFCDPSKSRVRHHCNIKAGLKKSLWRAKVLVKIKLKNDAKLKRNNTKLKKNTNL